MGMYDTVHAKCPKCEAGVEFQSKAGPCHLKNYSVNSVPAAVAEDIAGGKVECVCGTFVEITLPHPIPRVVMAVRDANIEREYD